MKKIRSFFKHLFGGTLISRLRDGKKHALYRQYNEFIESGREFIEKRISKNLVLKLHRNANLSRELFCYGFEESEMLFFRKFLKPGDCVIDIGANIGLFTLISSEMVSEKGLVYSFEPSPRTYDWLNENIRINSLNNVRPNKAAISDKNGSVDFFISQEGFDAFNSIIKPHKGTNYISESVPAITLDSFIERESLEKKVTLIKIDVEGFEIPLLEGGSKTLSNSAAPHLIVEFTENNALNAGASCRDLYDKITNLGYTLYEYDAATNQLVAEPRGKSYEKYKNLIATKDPEAINKRIRNRSN